jgi:hypothetical protein
MLVWNSGENNKVIKEATHQNNIIPAIALPLGVGPTSTAIPL